MFLAFLNICQTNTGNEIAIIYLYITTIYFIKVPKKKHPLVKPVLPEIS